MGATENVARVGVIDIEASPEALHRRSDCIQIEKWEVERVDTVPGQHDVVDWPRPEVETGEQKKKVMATAEILKLAPLIERCHRRKPAALGATSPCLPSRTSSPQNLPGWLMR